MGDDGTYDIDYDDGEKETGVASNLVKPLEGASAPPAAAAPAAPAGPALAVGAAVNARCECAYS